MLNKRLIAISNLIEPNLNNIVVDIGCDHAYLSIYLLTNMIVGFVYNIDINKGPLYNGYKNVVKYNLINQTKFICNNGLNGLNLNVDIDYLTISGLGANSIINIISNNKNNNCKYYIVQPNSDLVKLRKFLKNSEYIIDDELIVCENKIYYIILKFHKSNLTNITSDIDLVIGPILKNSQQLVLKQYLIDKYNYLAKFNLNKVNIQLKLEFDIIYNFLYEKKWIDKFIK